MLPDTIRGLLIFIAFLIPGLLLEFGIEQQVSYRRTSLTDRWLRFFLDSTVYQFIFSWLGFIIWKEIRNKNIHMLNAFPTKTFALIGLAYVVLPLIIGSVVGYRARKRKNDFFVNLLVGLDASPQAWDDLFMRSNSGFVRARMKDGRWVAGIYGEVEGSTGFASSFPEDQDIFLPVQLEIDPNTGVISIDDDGVAVRVAWGLHLRRTDMDIFEYQSI